MVNIITGIKLKLNSKVLSNSIWGVTGSILQNIFLTLFYLIIARHYTIGIFSEYIIASNLYQMFIAFSAMGLGQWFIREVIDYKNKNELGSKFLKMQAYFGIFFFTANIVISLILYDNSTIRMLSVLFAINIIFDNIIYAIKNINISQYAQKKTVKVLFIEAFSKFAVACLLFVYPFSIYILTLMLVLIRFITLNLFLRIGIANGLDLTQFWKTNVTWDYIKNILKHYWPFAVIGSTYIIYWKSATLIISKMLPLQDVAFYENAYKIFSLAHLIPLVLSSTLLPKFVNYVKTNSIKQLKSTYNKAFYICLYYGLGVFTFMYSFADELIPLAFGEKYILAIPYTKEMFLSIIFLPTALLQAQLLIALGKEKLDMWFNINSVIINVAICLLGLYFIQSSLTVINYSILITFAIFHFSQDLILIKQKMINQKHIFSFLGISITIVLTYTSLANYIQGYILFPSYWLLIIIILIIKTNGFKHFFENE